MGKITLLVQPGDRFGRGVVVSEIRMTIGDRRRGARLLCDCGTSYEASLSRLFDKKDPLQSCGCLASYVFEAYIRSPEGRAAARANGRSHGKENLAASNARRAADSMKGHLLYGTWQMMLNRCYNPNCVQFKDWGGRGIEVCDRWHDPVLFIEDIERLIGPRPDGKTLDRFPDNDGNYEPGNVRWATRSEQALNSRGNRKLTVEAVIDIKQRLAMGEPAYKIAIIYDVVATTVYNIKKGKTWSWVEFPVAHQKVPVNE
jgi:hypothetical protein